MRDMTSLARTMAVEDDVRDLDRVTKETQRDVRILRTAVRDLTKVVAELVRLFDEEKT